MTAISVKNLSITLKDRKILDNINLDIESGQSYTILGGSGCGKSVLIKSMIGLLIPDQGTEVTIGDEKYSRQPIGKRPHLLEQFGMLFQGGALFDSMKIWENISFQPRNQHKLTRKDAYDLAHSKLKLVGLEEEVLLKYPKELSGGMQKRVALARAIANNPKIIFFDEPTAGLDPINAAKISHLIRKLSHEIKATTVTITHDMHCVQIISDKIGMLEHGNLIWEGKSLKGISNSRVKQFVSGDVVE